MVSHCISDIKCFRKLAVFSPKSSQFGDAQILLISYHRINFKHHWVPWFSNCALRSLRASQKCLMDHNREGTKRRGATGMGSRVSIPSTNSARISIFFFLYIRVPQRLHFKKISQHLKNKTTTTNLTAWKSLLWSSTLLLQTVGKKTLITFSTC